MSKREMEPDARRHKHKRYPDSEPQVHTKTVVNEKLCDVLERHGIPAPLCAASSLLDPARRHFEVGEWL